MKKRVILFCIMIAMVFLLTSCIPTNDDNNNGVIPDDNTLVQEFIDITLLNFNLEYNNPSKPEEKGFVLYDALNLNSIRFASNIKKTPIFEIYYGENLEKEIRKSEQGTVYPSYTFRKTGLYTIMVNAPNSAPNGGVLTNTFEVNVRANGYPDKVEFDIFDADKQKVNAVQAGETYTISARVYSDNILLEQDNEKFVSYWFIKAAKEENNQRATIVSIGNERIDKQATFTFKYECTNTYIETKNCIVDVINNYDGIEVEYSLYVKDGIADVPVKEEKVGNDGDFNFFRFASAQHKYTNGDTEKITINYTTNKNEEGVIVPFIKYNGETEFHRYIRGEKYINDGETYQFDPRKDRAEIYFAICYFEQFVGGSRPQYYEVEQSRVLITLTKD